MKYYAFCPHSGIQYFDAEENAKAYAEDAMDFANQLLGDFDSDDNEDQISWGEVKERVTCKDREPTDDEQHVKEVGGFVRELSLDSAND